MQPIGLPTTSRPGSHPGEYGGRLINVAVEREGDSLRYRPTPGLTALQSVPGQVRGAILVLGSLYVVAGFTAVRIDEDGSVTTLTGTVAGTGPVTLAANRREDYPDIVCVSSAGAYVLTETAVSSYPDGDLPQPSSVTCVDGYFLFPVKDGNGTVFQSGLDNTSVSALAYNRVYDNVLRVIGYAGFLLIFGETQIQVWQTSNALDWAFSRVAIIPIGIRGPWCVGGWEPGWSGPILFVSDDGAVHRMDGMSSTTPVSTPDVERAIAAVARDELYAHAYTVNGSLVWALSSESWTWEYDTLIGSWRERKSAGIDRWRLSGTTRDARGRWVGGDTLANRLLAVDADARDEAGDEIVSTVGTVPPKAFPARSVVSALLIDITLGHGDPAGGSLPLTNPRLRMRYSKDGASSWSAPIEREIGPIGKTVGPVRINRLGLMSHHGLIAEISISDPVHWCLLGMSAEIQQRRP